ncbi:MAG: hypothetical protein MR412_00510 [Firmicutes bacterium]|nr:hypothetical protein [Bacillota bacterium]MDY5676520.1 hypothetical protein [Eubacteriales bacterium]
MIKGANGKRFNYFMSAFFRLFCFVGCLIAFIVVKIAVRPSIDWLNYLLLGLSLGGLVSGVFNLILCGLTATAYKTNKRIQIICLIVTILTGGIVGTTLTSVALGTRVLDDEVENEKIFKIKK